MEVPFSFLKKAVYIYIYNIYFQHESSRGLIYKMLRRNQQVCIRVIHKMIIRTENARMPLRCEIYESQMILNLSAAEQFQISAL